MEGTCEPSFVSCDRSRLAGRGRNAGLTPPPLAAGLPRPHKLLERAPRPSAGRASVHAVGLVETRGARDHAGYREDEQSFRWLHLHCTCMHALAEQLHMQL